MEALRDRARAGPDLSVDELEEAIETMNVFDKYYADEQKKRLEQRATEVGPERIQQVQEEWAEIFAAAGKEMQAGTDPGDPRVLELARRSRALVKEFSGGDQGIEGSLGEAYRNEPRAVEIAGTTKAVFEYLMEAQIRLQQSSD